RYFPGAILYQKGKRPEAAPRDLPATSQIDPQIVEPLDSQKFASDRFPALPPTDRLERETSAYVEAEGWYAAGRYADAIEILLPWSSGRALDPRIPALLARAYANRGNLDDALSWCERWIDLEKLDPSAHYLCAAILLERKDEVAARAELQRALYLD